MKFLKKIIYAGRLAPSAHGSEDTFTIQIEDQEARKKVEERTSMFMGDFKDPFYRAPHILAVLSLRDANTGCGAFDGALVLGNMMLAATALNVGSCWINTAQLDTMTDDSVLLGLMACELYHTLKSVIFSLLCSDLLVMFPSPIEVLNSMSVISRCSVGTYHTLKGCDVSCFVNSKSFGSVAFDGVGYLALGYPASDDFFKQPRKVPLYNNRTIKI